MKTRLSTINDFLAPKKLAVAGASRDPKKFGNTAIKELTQKGFVTFPVNPHAAEINGLKCYATVADLPEDVDRLLIVTKKTLTEEIVRQAIAKGIRHIWIQQMSQTPEAIQLAESAGVNLVAKECILMFAEPVKSIHKFHRTIKRLFGMLPK